MVVLDGRLAFTTVDPAGVTIYWGAYLGAPDQILVSGPLAKVAGEIERAAGRGPRPQGLDVRHVPAAAGAVISSAIAWLTSSSETSPTT